MYSTGEVCDVTIEVVAKQGHNTQQLQYLRKTRIFSTNLKNR